MGSLKNNNKYDEIGKEVIDLQIKKLKNSIDHSFTESVKLISKCKSKVIVCGVGKSGIIASKISATLSSVGTPSFVISASDCSHGDLGRIDINDILILISNSGNTYELKNIIKYAKVNKIKLICIVSNKNSYLYKSSDIKILIPEVQEAGFNIVPTSSTSSQLALGDALSIALMKKKKFSKLDFKKFHPSGNLGNKLKTAHDVMLSGNKIPFVNENMTMKKALRVLNLKKLGFIVIINNQKVTKGIFTDGDLKRLIQKNKIHNNLKIKQFIKINPYAVEENTLAFDVLKQMNKKKITSAFVHNKRNKNKTNRVIHIHNLLSIFK